MGHAGGQGRHTVVTSFNLDIYRRYGHRFIESFRRYFWNIDKDDPKLTLAEIFREPQAAELIVYPEPDVSGLLTNHTIPYECAAGLLAYEGAVRQFPALCGQLGKYDIQHDATQARGIFISCDAMERFGGKVWWIDADVIVHAPVTAGWLDMLLPDSALCCYLGRDGWSYSETGIVGYNAEHPKAAELRAHLRGVFATGAIFTQPAWHDGIGFDWVRHGIFNNDPTLFVDLAADRSKVPQGCMHPLINSELGARFDHLKGKRKTNRSSWKEDLAWARPEQHWQDAPSQEDASV